MDAADVIGIIQIAVGVIALIVAIVALFKVLKQIDISNKQTKISIAQMDKLNEERVFELKLRLISNINQHTASLRKLKSGYESLDRWRKILLVIAESENPDKVDHIKDNEGMVGRAIEKQSEFSCEYQEELKQMLLEIDDSDISRMENMLSTTVKKQKEIDIMLDALESMNKTLENNFIMVVEKEPLKALLKTKGINI